jgi:predicted DNA-binding transcriptional regulator YafY
VTRPTARMLTMLSILQAGGTRSVGDLSARLGVDERTVRRYATRLAELDVPVQSVRGRHGGYRLAPGGKLPPLMLTDDEAVAVSLGLLAARRSEPGAVSAAVESAAAKLRRVLPEPLGRRIDAHVPAAAAATIRPAPHDVQQPCEVSVVLHARAAEVRPRLPAGVSRLQAVDGGTRLQLRTGSLDRVASALAWIGVPFTVEYPDALRTAVLTLAERLSAGAAVAR